MNSIFISFFDINRNEVMTFNDFTSFQTGALSLIYFKGKVCFDFFHLETNFESEKSDFENFKSRLEEIYYNNKKYATFSPLAGKIQIQLEREDDKINVNCEIWNESSNCKLNFYYTIDQSFLPELIRQLYDMLLATTTDM